MKISFPMLDEPFEFKQTEILVIEDTKAFASFIKWINLYPEQSKLKIFNSNFSNLKSSELIVITDVFSFDVNSAAMIKLIYADLEYQLNEKPEVKSLIDKLTSTITELIDYELLEHELDLEDDEVTIIELFKALGIKIEVQSDSVFERLIEILQIYKYLVKKKLLVLINTCSYFTQDEMNQIIEYIHLNSLDVLFIEPREVCGMSQFILDNDYFLFHKDNV